MKTCTKCASAKPLSEFSTQPSAKDGRHSWCRLCAREARRGVKRRHTPEKTRKWALKTRYGLSVADVERMLDAQGNRCGICAQPLARFHIDHDHASGSVRGILCHGCNVRIGKWDNAEWFAAALRYVGLRVEALQAAA